MFLFADSDLPGIWPTLPGVDVRVLLQWEGAARKSLPGAYAFQPGLQ